MTEQAAYRQLASALRTQIEAGEIRDGSVLPTTRALAAKWETSVYTADSAVRLLIDEGLIEARDRSHRIVTSRHLFPDLVEPVAVSVPTVVLIGGYAGSGKTYFGRILGHLTRWGVIDKDTITRQTAEVALVALGSSADDRESSTYLDHVRPAEYAALRATIAENIGCGSSVIATAPFIAEYADPGWPNQFGDAIESLGGRAIFVWVHCDAEQMHQQIKARGAARDTAKLADWPAYADALNLGLRPNAEHIVINNSSGVPLGEQAQGLLASLTSS